MATAEEILAAMTAEETQQVLVIDNDLRTIAIPEGVTLLGVTSDENVRRLHFAMPRMYGEVDLSAFALRINYLNAGNEGDVYPVADAETDGDTIRFSWLVGRHACKYKGDVRFIVCAKLTGDDGEIAQEYNTTLATLPVLEGLETGEAIVQAHPDVIESILARLDTLEQEGGGVSSDAIAAAVAAYLSEHPVEAGATAEQAAQIEANKKAIEALQQSSSGGITEETDPTVPAWAKQPSKPTYTAGEVGARPDSWTPSASDVGADAAGTAAAQVGAHNVSGDAHADMRALIEGLTSRLNALADSDDKTLDQLSEIVAYIKSNKALIDAVTTGKVSTGDIVDNLTTNASGKVLSAAQGVALKSMIDAIVIPDKLPNPQPLTINGQSYDGSAAVEVSVTGEGAGVEVDATLTQSGKAADAKVVGDKLSELNEAKVNETDLAKVAKSGSYDDLTDKPTIPTVPTTLPNPNKLILTGAVTAEYDGSSEVSVEIPAVGGSAYELPIASATQLGGVLPVAKTDDMTQAVGVDEAGGLWTMAGEGNGEAFELIGTVDLSTAFEFTGKYNGKIYELQKAYRRIIGILYSTGTTDSANWGLEIHNIGLSFVKGININYSGNTFIQFDAQVYDGFARSYFSRTTASNSVQSVSMGQLVNQTADCFSGSLVLFMGTATGKFNSGSYFKLLGIPSE